MLYSIIPPVLVVASVIGIIIFLVKKAPQVARIEESERQGDSFAMQSVSGSLENKSGQKFLVVLEKLVRRLRMLFLKLEHYFMLWSENIRKKRKSRLIHEKTKTVASAGETMGKVLNYESGASEIDGVAAESSQSNELKKNIKPMISERVVEPRTRVETKDRLEKILIDRIAANPKDTEAYERLGEYYFEIGNYEHAKECFKQVMKLEPANTNVRARMRRLERLLYR